MDHFGQKDPVSVLMEWVQKNPCCKLEFIDNLKTLGESHNPRFLCIWKVDSDYTTGVFHGNKKTGKKMSALLALRHLEVVDDIGTETSDTTDIKISDSLTVPVLTSSVDDVVKAFIGHHSSVNRPEMNSTRSQGFIPAFSNLLSQPVHSSTSPRQAQESVGTSNPISILHEIGQKLGIIPNWDVKDRTGPAHNPIFTVWCSFGPDIRYEVQETSKTKAKTRVFELVLEEVKRRHPEYLKMAPSVSRRSLTLPSAITQDPVISSTMEQGSLSDGKNAVSEVMEMGNKLGIIPKFDIQQLSDIPGPERFRCICSFGEEVYEPGLGSNKKEAKLAAAKKALENLRESFDSRLSAQRYGIASPDIQENFYIGDMMSSNVQAFDRAAVENLLNQKNPISALNEKAQKEKCTLRCEEVQSEGPPHCKMFEMRWIFNGIPCPSARDKTKAEAKKKAAELSLCYLLKDQLQISPRADTQPSDEAPHEEPWDEPNNSMVSTRAISMTVQSRSPLESISSQAASMMSSSPKSLVGPEYDIIAQNVLSRFEQLKSTAMSSFGKLVLAGFVLEEKTDTSSQYKCVSLGTGNTVIGGGKLSHDGDVVHDCHAEIVARRGLLRFLYNNILMYAAGSDFSLFNLTGEGKLKLKESYTFHLYISTAPCGDGAVFSHNDTSGSREVMKPAQHRPNTEPKECGILRCKIEDGQGTVKGPTTTQTFDGIHMGNKLYTMSCSDKICKWNVMGVQGTLLSYMIDPIYIDSIVLGQLYNAGHLSRALCCRLSTFAAEVTEMTAEKYKLNHPTLAVAGNETQRSNTKSKEISFNWSLGDASNEIIDGPTGRPIAFLSDNSNTSRISRKALFSQFKQCCELLNKKDLESLDYLSTKARINQYSDLKVKLYSKFQSLGYSVWVRKPTEVSSFSL